MPNKQTLQLLSSAVAVKTNLEYQSKELKIFADVSKTTASNLTSLLAEVTANLQIVAACPPPIGKVETDLLLKCKNRISKLSRDLQLQLEKPYLQFQSHVNSVHNKIVERMFTQACKLDSGSAEKMRKYLNQALDIILEMNKQFADCLQYIDKCKAKLQVVEAEFNRLNLPRDIEAITKEVVKISASLASLDLQISQEPPQKYEQQFLPLQQALSKLQQQSGAFLGPRDTAQSSSVSESSRPQPGMH